MTTIQVIALMLSGAGIGIGICCIVANEIIKFAEREHAREDAAYDRAHGDVIQFPLHSAPVTDERR